MEERGTDPIGADADEPGTESSQRRQDVAGLEFMCKGVSFSNRIVFA
jgi:hypothetical protein